MRQPASVQTACRISFGTMMSIVTVFLSCTAVPSAWADGERDNNPESVRRIPKDGVPVPADREQALRVSLKTLQDVISQLRRTNNTTVSELLELGAYDQK